ncbi:uncharacterized protein LOC121372476 isoform X2 [Gigantopelta aegis]|uniref:uncharacterized protein LOC121372476 isoform X2 n=1 Tax=Gigantopelta aegis TaxID=1735272 RepID=UPI001B88A98F|nr:uncharacterized protein LOC121372476 isoform X2 [Gigantopelta aegis]
MLQETLKPLTTTMKIFGIYHVTYSTKVVSTSMETSQTEPKERVLKHIFCLRTHSFLLTVLVWANFLRCISSLLPVNSNLNFRIIIMTWLGLVASCSTIMFVACQKSSHLPSFYKHWNDMCEKADALLMNAKFTNFSKAAVTGTVLSMIIVLTNLSGILFLIYWEDMGLEEDAIWPFTPSTATTVVLCFIMILASGIHVLYFFFLITLCYIIKSCFYKLSEFLRKQIKDGGEQIPRCLRECRLLHVYLCECVAVLDRTFGILIAIVLATNVPMACFILYQFINYKLSVVISLVFTFWMGTTVLTIAATTISAALVHEAAHSPIDHIFKLQTNGANMDESIQVNLFLGQSGLQ